MKYCSKCGSELKPGTTFCGVCGSQISSDVFQGNDLGTESSIPYKKNRSTKKIGAIIIAAFIIFGGAAGAVHQAPADAHADRPRLGGAARG